MGVRDRVALTEHGRELRHLDEETAAVERGDRAIVGAAGQRRCGSEQVGLLTSTSGDTETPVEAAAGRPSTSAISRATVSGRGSAGAVASVPRSTCRKTQWPP